MPANWPATEKAAIFLSMFDGNSIYHHLPLKRYECGIN